MFDLHETKQASETNSMTRLAQRQKDHRGDFLYKKKTGVKKSLFQALGQWGLSTKRPGDERDLEEKRPDPAYC